MEHGTTGIPGRTGMLITMIINRATGMVRNSHGNICPTHKSSTRVPYQRDVDDGGKRKNLTKLNNKASKKAKVENEPKK